MKTLTKKKSKITFNNSMIAMVVCTLSSVAYAWDVPSNLREEGDVLTWDSNAPSYNVYEDGNYIATVHDADSFSPIFDNSLYQVVAHDHGTAFSTSSAGFLYLDDVEDDAGDDDDGEDLEFDEAELYFELNNTDGDLGIHSIIDGDAWSNLKYQDINGRVLLDVQVTGMLADQGLTEFFFESAEPTFDEVSPGEFFSRFPGGIYDFEGITIEGQAIEAETELSQVLPAPAVVRVGANASEPYEGCEDDPSFDPAAMLDLSGGLPVQWDPVVSHHPEIGAVGDVEVALYQFVFEGDEVKLTVDLDANTTSFTVPAELVNSGEFGKLEVIVRDSTHNQVGTEACFRVL